MKGVKKIYNINLKKSVKIVILVKIQIFLYIFLNTFESILRSYSHYKKKMRN